LIILIWTQLWLDAYRPRWPYVIMRFL